MRETDDIDQLLGEWRITVSFRDRPGLIFAGVQDELNIMLNVTFIHAIFSECLFFTPNIMAF